MIILCQHHKDHNNADAKDQIQLRKEEGVKWRSINCWISMNPGYCIDDIDNTHWNDLRIVFDKVNKEE